MSEGGIYDAFKRDTFPLSGFYKALGRYSTFLSILVIGALAAYLRLVDIESDDLANVFYASAIRSMGESWYHFFYAAFDPEATLMVDKPPLGLWFQVLSTKTFGFNGFALILPMALAGVVGVVATFFAARRSHGVIVGLLAALFLAIFPESVATSRDTTMDALIMLLLAVGAWQLIVVVEQRRRWLLVGYAFLMGIAFNVKFFQAFLVLPAAVVYLFWGYRGYWRDLVVPLALALIVGIVISLSWVVFVDMTPEENRPLVMNDASNSAIGLAFRYNGIERIISPRSKLVEATVGSSGTRRGSLSSGRFGVGNPGPLRLFKPANGALMGYGVCLALGGLVIAWIRNRRWFLEGPGLFWGVWLITGVIFFNASHRAPAHYTEAYAPAIAVLAAVGLVEAWRATGPISKWWIFRHLPASLMLPCLCGMSLAYAWAVYDTMPPMDKPVLISVLTGGFATASLLVMGRVNHGQLLKLSAKLISVASILAVMFITSLWIALKAPRLGQITNPNPITYVWGSEGKYRSVPSSEVLEFYAGVLPEAKYRFAITSINDAGEAIAGSGESILPLWNDYLDMPILPSSDLRALISGNQIPVVLVRSSLVDSFKLKEIQTILNQACHSVRIPNVTPEWTLWDCVQPSKTAGRVSSVFPAHSRVSYSLYSGEDAFIARDCMNKRATLFSS